MFSLRKFIRAIWEEIPQPIRGHFMKDLGSPIPLSSLAGRFSKFDALQKLSKWVRWERAKKFAGEAERSVVKEGIDIVAFYAPFHFFKDYWGIYVVRDMLHGLAWLAYNRVGISKLLKQEIVHDTLDAVMEHALLHFRVEFLTLLIEAAFMCPVYIPYYYRSRKDSSYSLEEEAIANAHMLTKDMPQEVKEVLRELSDASPPGYRDYRHFMRGDRSLDYKRIDEFFKTNVLKDCYTKLEKCFSSTSAHVINFRGLPWVSVFVWRPILSHSITSRIPIYIVKHAKAEYSQLKLILNSKES